MKAEIISIGSELTSGQNLDTNSQWLSQRLAELGIAVRWHTTLADDLDENVDAFRIACQRAGLVLITGGLGPTQDDLTREALARLAGVELVFHEPSFLFIQDLFTRRGRTMPERNRVQAMFPKGSEPIPNPQGTAPGIWMSVSRKDDADSASLFAAMPGVPNEMRAMFADSIRPRLLPLAKASKLIVQRKINCFGAGESAVEEKLLDLTRRGGTPEVGITVSDATISLRILATAGDMASARRQIEPVEQLIRERLGDLVFGVDEEDLQDAVAHLLAKSRQTLAVAEGLTGGVLGHRLTLVPGISALFLGSIVAYSNEAKTGLLSIAPSLIAEHGAVSAAVAEAMAVACRTRFRSDLALSTVGIAGPHGATEDKPLGLVHVGLATADGVTSYRYNWFGTRPEIQSRTAKMALNALRLHLAQQLRTVRA